MTSSTPSKPVRWFVRAAMVAILALGLSLGKIAVGQSVISVIYTVNGIMFSIALSQLVSFSFTDIDNDEFVRRQRKELDHLRISFIVLFSLSTVAFLFSGVNTSCVFINPVCFSLLLFGLVYNIVNFCGLAKTKDAIEDKVRAARKRG